MVTIEIETQQIDYNRAFILALDKYKKEFGAILNKKVELREVLVLDTGEETKLNYFFTFKGN